MKKRINSYIFNPATRTITLTGITVQLDALLLITNLTDNIIIFNFADETKKATVTGSDIVLQFDTTAMSNTDELQIFYDDAASYPLTDSELRATAIPVTTNGLTNAELRNQAVTINGSVSTANGLTDTQLRATPIPISGTVNTTGLTDAQLRASDIKVTLDGETVPVTGTFYQATQPVSGPLTNTELRATAVPITGNVTTGGLTDVELRATPVAVSGTVSTGGLTEEQLRSSDLKVTLDGETVPTVSANYAVALAYNSVGGLAYLGNALPGSSSSSSVWRIQKFNYDASNNLTSIFYANGQASFINIWDNRESLTYS